MASSQYGKGGMKGSTKGGMAAKGYSTSGLNPGPPPWFKQHSSQWPTSQKAPAKKPGILGKIANEAKGAFGYTKNYYANKLAGAKAAITPTYRGGAGNVHTRSQLSKLGRY